MFEQCFDYHFVGRFQKIAPSVAKLPSSISEIREVFIFDRFVFFIFSVNFFVVDSMLKFVQNVSM